MRDLPLRCTLKDGIITIRVSRKVLGFAADNHPTFWDGDKQTVNVTNLNGFAQDVLNALNDEGEDGSTPVSRLLDKAIEHAVDQGSEHVEINE